MTKKFFCSNCGNPYLPHHNFCKKCGAPLSGASVSKNINQRKIPLWEQLYDEGTILLQENRPQEALEKFKAALKFNTTDFELLSNLGITHLHLKNFKEAREWLDRALKIKPNNPITLLNKAILLSKEIQYEKAIETLETLLHFNPSFSNARLMLMQIKRQKQMFGDLKIDERGIPTEAVEEFKKGVRFAHNNQLSESFNSFKSAAEIYPEFGEAYMFMGMITMMRGDPQLSLKYLNKSLDIDPTLIQAWQHKGWVFDKMEQYQKAIECYEEAIKIDPFVSSSWNNKGLALERLGKMEEAIKAYDKSIELNPDYDGAYHNRAVAYKQIGKIELAIRDYKKALELNPSNEEARENIEHLRRYSAPLGGVTRTVHDARDYCPRCHKKNLTNSPRCIYCNTPMYTENFEELLKNAVELENLGAFEEAIMTFIRITDKDPTNSQAWYYRGKAHCALAEFENALTCFGKAQQLGFPPMKLMMYGLSAKSNLTNFKRPNLSQSHLEKVEAKCPIFFPNEETWLITGAAYQMLMQYEEAYKSYQNSLVKNPNYEPAKKNLEFIASLSQK